MKSLSSTLELRLRGTDSVTRRAVETATELVVFGSMAPGIDDRNSDLDLLCITPRPLRYKDRKLDLLCLSEAELQSTDWLCSELAAHVAAYGIWLRSPSNWIHEVRLGESAIARKQRRLQSYAITLRNGWWRLNDHFKAKYVMKLRREAQRLLLLERRIPIPPTRRLDEAWQLSRASQDGLYRAVLNSLTILPSPVLEDFLPRLQPQATLIPRAHSSHGSTGAGILCGPQI
jgi:predicted nucleotidyltransferase